MDNVTKELKTNNMKLKGLVESVSHLIRASESCCMMCRTGRSDKGVHADADALKKKFLHRCHPDLCPTGARSISLYHVQEVSICCVTANMAAGH